MAQNSFLLLKEDLPADQSELLSSPTPSPSPPADAGTSPAAIKVEPASTTAATGFRDLSMPGGESTKCAVLETSLVAANQAGELWKMQNGGFLQIDRASARLLLDLAAGRGDTVWLLSHDNSNTFLEQVDLTGGQIREIPLPADLRDARSIAGSRNTDSLLLTINLGAGTRLVGLRWQNADSRQSLWEKWLDRSLTNFSYFDLRNGSVVPAETRTDSPAVFIKPANNPMENTRQPPFQLTAAADASGVWIYNSDGLPLFQICETKNVKQVRWDLRGEKELRVYVSDGTVVEEYKVTGLENLYRFDAGSFD